MPIRIYALAKQLNIENKDLVEACAKAGIKGKGSALASLSDEEVVKIKAFLENNKKKAAPQPTADDVLKPVRSSQAPAAKRPIKVLQGSRESSAVGSRYSRSRFSTGISAETSAQAVAESPSATQTLAPPTDDEEAVEESLTESPESGEVYTQPEPAAPEAKTKEKPPSRANIPLSRDAGPAEDQETQIDPVADSSAAVSPPQAKSSTETAAAADQALEESPVVTVADSSAPLDEASTADRESSMSESAEDEPSVSIAAQGPAESFDDSAPEAEPPSDESDPSQKPTDVSLPRRDPLQSASAGKIKMLGERTKKASPGKRQEPDKSRQKRPLVKLPKMPELKQPKAKPKKQEKTQKPVMRLPKDAIAGHKKGKPTPLPLQDHLRKGEKGQGKKQPREASPPGDGVDKSRRRRGGKAGDDSLTELGSVRQRRNKTTRAKRSRLSEDESQEHRRPRRQPRRPGPKKDTAKPRKGKVVLELPCTVRSFSEAAGVGAVQVLRTLMGLGAEGLNINAQIDPEMVELLAVELGVDLAYKQETDLEESLVTRLQEEEDAEELLAPRPPVVTFLGHVDHGKTSLLDYIIGTNVVAGEAGGITQHIRAYQIEKDERRISFVDTPGHAAFTEMRARGANVTDIAVLVVAADDGVMPQTEEAISHAKASGAPIVVALNKIDLPGADPNRVMQQLATHDLLPSEWGGDTEVIQTSATKGDGVNDLLDTLLLTADINEYKANPNRAGMGICLEAEQESERGVIAKLIVQKGTLSVGDCIVCGAAYGRVKALYDTLRPRRKLEEAGPSTPVNVTGLQIPPEAGDPFVVVPDIAQARQVAESRDTRVREQELSGHTKKVSLEEFQRRLAAGEIGKGAGVDVIKLNLIIRADTRGSIEAITAELGKIQHAEIEIQIRQALVGGVSTADVALAEATDAVIIAFNVIPDESARALADDRNVEIRRYDVIYKVADDIRATLEQKLKPEERVVELGRAIILQTFTVGRVGVIAGCRVIDGSIERGCKMRLYRENRLLGEYPMESLRREKDDVREVVRGMECGIKLVGFNDVRQDDVLEAYKIEEVARKL